MSDVAERKAIGARNEEAVREALARRGWAYSRLELDPDFLDLIRPRKSRLSKLPDWAAYHAPSERGPILVDAKGGGMEVEEQCVVLHRLLLDMGYGEDVLYAFVREDGIRAAWLDTVERYGVKCLMRRSQMPGRVVDFGWTVSLDEVLA